jgi:hypothetical protein
MEIKYAYITLNTLNNKKIYHLTLDFVFIQKKN